MSKKIEYVPACNQLWGREEKKKMYFLKNYDEFEKAKVKMHNASNLLCFSKFTDTEANLLSVLFHKITRKSSSEKYHDGDEVFISSDEIKKFLPYTQAAYDKKYYRSEWESFLAGFCKKIVGNILLQDYTVSDKRTNYRIAVLFQSAEYDFQYDDYGNFVGGLTVKLGYMASTFFLNANQSFFNYSLPEYISLKGAYAKRLYQLLKSEQFKLESDWNNRPWGIEFEAERFKFAMGMQSLRAYDIKRILDKTCAYLSGATDEKIGPIFYMLEWHPIKEKSRGRKIIKYAFTWTVSDKELARAQMKAEARKMKQLQQELWKDSDPLPSAKADEPLQEKEDAFDKLVDW